MIFTRDTSAACMLSGGASTSCRTPSTRKRTATLRSNGSTWMSLALALHRLVEERVHEADRGRVVAGLEQIGRLRDRRVSWRRAPAARRASSRPRPPPRRRRRMPARSPRGARSPGRRPAGRAGRTGDGDRRAARGPSGRPVRPRACRARVRAAARGDGARTASAGRRAAREAAAVAAPRRTGGRTPPRPRGAEVIRSAPPAQEAPTTGHAATGLRRIRDGMRSRSRSELSAIWRSVEITCGVRKTSRLVFTRSVSSCLKRLPSTGTSFRNGTPRSPTRTVSASRPPMTTVCRSRAPTTVLAERIVVVGPTWFGSPIAGFGIRSMSDTSSKSVRCTKSSAVMRRREPQRDADVVAFDGGEEVRQVGRAGRAAGDEGHVAADDDLGLLVVGGDHVGSGQHVDVALRLERAEQHGVCRHLLAARQGHGLVAGRREDEPGQRRRIAHRRAERREVHLAEADGRPAEGCCALQLDPERAQLVGGRLQDDGLDEDLPAAHVEIADHAAQRLPVRRRGAHDERVGGGVGRDAHGSLERNGRAGPGADRLRLRRRCGRWRRLAHPAVVADGRLVGLVSHAAAHDRAAALLRRRWRRGRQSEQLGDHAHQALGLRVAQAIDVELRRARHRDVEPCCEAARARHVAGRAVEQQAVGPRLGHDAERATLRRLGRQRLAKPSRQLVGGGEAERHRRGRPVAAGRHVEIAQDRGDAVDVRRGVDDHEAVRRRVGREHAVLRDDRLHHRHDGGRVGVAQRQDPRHQLVACPGARRDGGFAALANRDDLHEVSARDRGEALHLEDRLEDEIRFLGRDARR